MKKINFTKVLILVLVLFASTLTFASDFEMDIEFPNGLILDTDCQFRITGLEKDAEVSVISLDRIDITEKSIITIDSRNKSIKISEPGNYKLKVKVGNEINEYYIKIDEMGVFYGKNKDILNYEIQMVNVKDKRIESQFEIRSSVFDVEQYVENNDLPNNQIGVSDIDLLVESLDFRESAEKVDIRTYINEEAHRNSIVEVMAENVACSYGGPYLINTEYPVKCTYTNFTTTNAINVPLKIKINDSVVYSANVNANARSRYVITLQLTIPNANTYDVAFEVGQGALLSKTSRTFLFSESIGKNLDYYVLDTPNNSQPFDAREKVVFRNLLQNTGTIDTGIFDFDLFFNNKKVGTYQMRNIVPGEKVNLNFELTNPVQGTYPVKFVMDPTHQLTNKNLVKELMTTWNGNGADLVIKSNTVLTPTPFHIDTDLSFQSVIVNQGSKNVNSNVSGTVYAREETTGQRKFVVNYNVNQMNVDDEISFNYNIVLNKIGNWVIVNEIDINNNVLESNENNNTHISGVAIISKPIVINYAWYSQKDPNYNDTKLEKLFMPNLSDSKQANTPMEWWGGSYSAVYANPNGNASLKKGHINRWGCVACSCAMVLTNVDARTINAQKDFRNDAEYRLSPDPFTLIMANKSFPEITYNENSSIYEINSLTGNTPTYMGVSDAISYFGYETSRTSFSGQTNEEIYDVLVELINQNAEGVMVRMGGQHTLVFVKNPDISSRVKSTNNREFAKTFIKNNTVKLTPEIEAMHYELESNAINQSLKPRNATTSEKTIDDFIVCDSATPDESKGSNVRYADTPWTSGEFPNLTDITYIDIID